MTRWKLTIEYDGSAFFGWQKQAEDISVQQILEEAIEKFSSEKIRLFVAGRTDTGVHARAQIAHFDLQKEYDAIEIQGAINFHIKEHRISIISAEIVPDNFHARFDALSRTYRYLIINRRPTLALNKGKAWHFPRPLELAPMQEAAALLIGDHDFSTFRAHHCQAKSPIKTMEAIDISQTGELFIFNVRARSFLYHQVRNIVGSLSLVGAGKWSVDDFNTAFQAADRTKGGPTAPAEGLYFWEVVYPENENKN
ncbi:MAG TPA: tRNA pseudouridine(38-40) synthase TruA [Rhodospirillaceae bacterium]|nr:tRNA pseudouridine(38-40) synthase TruA [Rhodospirillaceae bacterium]